MNTHRLSTQQRRLMAALCCLVGAGGAVSDSSALTLNSGNTSVEIDAFGQEGMFNWLVDGQDQLHQQWLWYRVGNNAESSIDTLSPQLTHATPSSATYLFTGAGFELEAFYSVTGGSPGSGTADVSEQFTIRNVSGGQLGMSLFLYTDFDLGQTAGGDTVTSFQWKPIPFSNPGFDRATQVDGGIQQTTTVSYFADRAEAAAYDATLLKLNDGVASNLANAGATFGPVGPGDMTYTFQWDLLLASGGSEIIGVDKLVTGVPEPTALSMAIVGLAGLLACRRRA